MVWVFGIIALLSSSVTCLTFRRDTAVVKPKFSPPADDCDPSSIPVMNSFDMNKFSGKWYELARTATGYLDVSDGTWKIDATNISTFTFLFTGRDNNEHCIRPIKGRLSSPSQPPGMLSLKYQTYTTYVEENIRVLFTDYETVAVVYTCVHHVHHATEACHVAGLVGGIWTRKPHVDAHVFDEAARYLEMACVHRSTLAVKNEVGPCEIDDLEHQIDDFPAPDFCYQPMDLGSCRGSLQRFYYEPQDKACKAFLYGGCGGNRNNFLSLSECQKKCATPTSRDLVCGSTAQCGIHCSPCCNEAEDGCINCSCEHIVVEDYLHCMRSSSECPDECEIIHSYPGCNLCRCDHNPELGDPHTTPCSQMMVEGDCHDNVERFYHDVQTGECKPFQFSGCHGNENNFLTYQECKETCQISDQRRMLRGPAKVKTANSAPYLNSVGAVVILMLTLQQLKYIRDVQ